MSNIWLMEIVHNSHCYFSGVFSKLTHVLEQKSTHFFLLVKFLLCCYNISPVVLELEIPAFLFLLRLEFFESILFLVEVLDLPFKTGSSIIVEIFFDKGVLGVAAAEVAFLDFLVLVLELVNVHVLVQY